MEPIFQDIVLINRDSMEVTVKNSKGQKYIVKPSKDMVYHIKHKSVYPGDFAKVVKSSVSKEWIMVDFKINSAIYDYDGYEAPIDVESDSTILTLEDYF